MNLLALFHLDTATMVALILSVVLPALSSLLAKAHWPAAAVGLLTLALATANGFFSEWAKDGSQFAWKAAVGTALVSYAIAVLSRYGFLKDTKLDAKLLSIGSKTIEGDVVSVHDTLISDEPDPDQGLDVDEPETVQPTDEPHLVDKLAGTEPPATPTTGV